MPKKIILSRYQSSGIDLTWTPSANRLDIGGWYDGCVGIEGESMTLGAFFRRLGITERDVKRALRGGEAGDVHHRDV